MRHRLYNDHAYITLIIITILNIYDVCCFATRLNNNRVIQELLLVDLGKTQYTLDDEEPYFA